MYSAYLVAIFAVENRVQSQVKVEEREKIPPMVFPLMEDVVIITGMHVLLHCADGFGQI